MDRKLNRHIIHQYQVTMDIRRNINQGVSSQQIPSRASYGVFIWSILDNNDCSCWAHHMENFPRYWPLCGEFTDHRWIPLTKGSEAELWYFLWSAPKWMAGQTIARLVIWDAIALIVTSLYWYNGITMYLGHFCAVSWSTTIKTANSNIWSLQNCCITM